MIVIFITAIFKKSIVFLKIAVKSAFTKKKNLVRIRVLLI